MKLPLVKIILLGVAVFLIGFNLVLDLSNERMHEDEWEWVRKGGKFFDAYFIHGDYSESLWQSHDSRDQPKLAEYIYGAWTRLIYDSDSAELFEKTNFDLRVLSDGVPISDDRWWVKYQAQYPQRDSIPIEWQDAYDIVVTNRYISVVFALGCGLMMFLIGKNLRGYWFGLTLMITLFINSLYFGINRKAMSDSILNFFLLGGFYLFLIWVGNQKKWPSLKRYFFMIGFGIWAGLGVSSKLNVLMMAILFVGWNGLYYLRLLVRSRNIKYLFALVLENLLVVVFTFLIFWILNPFIWKNTIDHTFEMFSYRTEVSDGIRDSAAAELQYESMLESAIAIFRVNLLPSQPYDYQRTFSTLPGFFDVTIFLTGIGMLIYQWFKKKNVKILALLYWTVGVWVIMSKYLVVGFDRYFLPIIPLIVCIEAWTLYSSLRFLLKLVLLRLLRWPIYNLSILIPNQATVLSALRKIAVIFAGLALLLLPAVYEIHKEYYVEITDTVQDVMVPIEKKLKLHAEALLWLKTSGRSIVNEQGELVVLRGVNVSSINWGLDDWNDQAVEYAVNNWNANVIRSRVFQDDWEVDEKEFFYNLERQIIKPARKSGAYVILHPWIHVTNDSLPDDDTIKMWQAIAEKYKNDPTVLYDVLAEPRGVSWEAMHDGYVKLIEAVQAVHPKALIFVSGLSWGREINSWLEAPLPYKNIVYRSNPYNKPAEFAGLFGEIALKYPVFLGEFGADAHPEMSKDSVKELISYADSLGIGWTAWNFADRGCPCLLSDASSFIASDYGVIVRHALASVVNPVKIVDEVVVDESRYLVYLDRFYNGYSEYSWKLTTVQQSNEFETADRGKVMRIQDAGTGGISFFQSSRIINTDKYPILYMDIMAEDIARLSLRLRTVDDQNSQLISLQEIVSGDVIVSTEESDAIWQTLEIDVRDYGGEIDLRRLTGFLIESVGTGSSNSIYLDNVYFGRADSE